MMRRLSRINYRFAFALGLLLCAGIAHTRAQDRIWQTLATVRVDYLNNAQLGYPTMFPTFSPDILALDGKEVTIRGYVVPMDEGMGFFALSSVPFQACFFCGKAGPETVIEIYPKKPVPYTQRAVSLRGRFEVNQGGDYLTHLLYILHDAELVQ